MKIKNFKIKHSTMLKVVAHLAADGDNRIVRGKSMNDDPELSRAVQRVDAAGTAMRSGDPQPYTDCWATSPDATLFGAWGADGAVREGGNRHVPMGREQIYGRACQCRAHRGGSRP